MTYNGYRNYATWNVILWISNDEPLYNLAKDCEGYVEFCEVISDVGIGLNAYETPDGIAWTDESIDREAVSRFWKETFSEVSA